MRVTDEQIRLLREWRDAWGAVNWARLRAQEVAPQMEHTAYCASVDLYDAFVIDREDAPTALPSDADAFDIVRKIAALDENDWWSGGILIQVSGPYDVSACRFCEAELCGDDATITAHKPDCLYVRACEIAARLPPATKGRKQ